MTRALTVANGKEHTQLAGRSRGATVGGGGPIVGARREGKRIEGDFARSIFLAVEAVYLRFGGLEPCDRRGQRRSRFVELLLGILEPAAVGNGDHRGGQERKEGGDRDQPYDEYPVPFRHRRMLPDEPPSK